MEKRRLLEMEQNAARIAAEAANLAKSEFLSNMSHELRTPLNAILGFAQLMESETPPPTPAQKVSIDHILQAGWFLLKLINEILDLSLIEAGKLSLSLEPMSIAEVLAACRAMLEPLAQKRGITMTFPSFETPCFVFADRVRVQQVLINLISNAIKYNRANGMIVIQISERVDGYLRMSVTDTGMGLTPASVADLFQPFNRLGQESGKEQGTGIGLVVTKRLVEAMQGKIGVESEVGVGTVFWVDLVAGSPTHTDLVMNETENPKENLGENRRPMRTVLYVEDNPANLQLVEMLFKRRSDLRLLSATNGDLGFELARTQLPDVILMDINLPGADGKSVLGRLRQEKATEHIPVIALSANASLHDIERGLNAGFFRYITKPIRVDELMDTLDLGLAYAESDRPAAASRAA